MGKLTFMWEEGIDTHIYITIETYMTMDVQICKMVTEANLFPDIQNRKPHWCKEKQNKEKKQNFKNLCFVPVP